MSTPVNDPFGLVGATIEGRYRVEAAVAEGGFAVVYRAHRDVLSKPVAIKVSKVPPRLSAEARREALHAFLEEARTLARLEHPAVARVIDFGVTAAHDGETPWMALDWIAGRTLSAWLAARGRERLPPGACLALLRPVLDALARAHALGIVHRDVKPSNLMLVDERDGRAADPPMRLLDFGIAKVMEAEAQVPSGGTRTETVAQAFSLSYAAPEQVTGTRTGPWTDVHGLALVLTELLTGEAPYQGNDSMALYLQVLSARRPTPARFGVDVGPWEPVLARALALLPAERYPDSGALLAALEARVPAAALVAPPAPEGPETPLPEVVRSQGSIGRWLASAAALAVGAGLVIAAFDVPRATVPDRPAEPAAYVPPPALDAGSDAPPAAGAPAPEAPPPDAASPTLAVAPSRVAPRVPRRIAPTPPASPAAPAPTSDVPAVVAAPARPDAEAPAVPDPAPVE